MGTRFLPNHMLMISTCVNVPLPNELKVVAAFCRKKDFIGPYSDINNANAKGVFSI